MELVYKISYFRKRVIRLRMALFFVKEIYGNK
ncbi:hypothetical protein ICW_02794 [Bacillus wiedmannii]|nr:hypothetical protein ICW_02794 [Bacillus wiedmannii]EJV64107.1 hypothetical protein IEO_02364 [Bacillus wiedmannii]OFD07587.1 hypothetical protein BTGOE6_22210 [Bacillus wiedmannii]